MRTCLVCGRRFHEGQGVVVKVRGGVLEFHSSRCASRFLRRLLEEYGGEDCMVRAVRALEEEYRRAVGAPRGKVI